MRTIRKPGSKILIGLALTVVCVAFGIQLLPQERPEGRERALAPVWPSPPNPATIRFLTSLPRTDQPSNRKSFFQRLGKSLFPQAEEGLIRPLGLVASEGTLYVADPGGHALLIFDADQKSVQKITKADNELLNSPVGVAVGKDRVFVSDSSLKRIFVYDRRGRFLKTFADQQLERPTGLALDEKTRKLYVTDTAAHRVLVYGDDGKLQKSFGQRGTANGEFNFPTNLWLDSEGSLLVVDSLNYRIQIFRLDGTFVNEFGRQGDTAGTFASPKGIAADIHGHIYVVDALFDTVQIFNRQGQLLLNFGERGIGPGQFWLPAGIFIDDKDRIYVADSYNQRIQVFEFLGGPDHGVY